jgi:Xaa-Pro dipeptidase
MPTDWNDVRHELDVAANLSDIRNSPWYADAVHDHFSDAEYERRYALARAAMAERDLDALLLTGSPNNYSLGGLVTWASGLIDDRAMCQYLVLPREGMPTLLYPHSGTHLEATRRMVAVKDMRGSGEAHYGEAIAEILREKGITGGRVGVSACDRNGPEYMGVAAWLALRDRLPDVELVFLDDLLHELTYLHSDEELAAMARAGELAIAALDAIVETAAPGRTEHELFAAATAAMLAGGGDVHLAMLTSMASDDPRAVYPAPRASGRVLRPGDVIINELSARHLGWSAKLGHPVTLGEPTPMVADFHRRSVAVFREFEDLIGPGVDLRDVQRAAAAFRRHGLQCRAMVLHGIDMVTAGPKVFVERVNAADYDRVLQPRMVVNIEHTPINLEGTFGTFLSRTYAITDDGARCLTPYPVDDVLVAS